MPDTTTHVPIWKQPPADRKATFDAVFTEMVPADNSGPSAKIQLRAVHALIIEKRAEGYTIAQICAGMKHPRIGITVTASYVGKLIKEANQKREKRREARLAAIAAAALRKPSTANGGKPGAPGVNATAPKA